jgi:hypothetical protein
MFYTYNDQRTDKEKQLEYELEEARRDAERVREQQEQERKARREEYLERARQYDREANNWPVAFQKQANLCWREHNQFPDDGDHFFKDSAEANEKALEFWREVAASKQAQLDELQKQIEAVWESIRLEVADKVNAVSDRTGYRATAQAIRDDSLDGYLDW